MEDDERGWQEVKSTSQKRREKSNARREERIGETVDLIRARHVETEAPVNLRWEAAGDARHATETLRALKAADIPFNAEIHHFEDEGHTNSERAKASLGSLGGLGDSTITQRFDQDVRRGATGSRSQDFIFIRNLVGTDEESKTESHTGFREVRDLHRDAMRRRRGSLSEHGELLIGGSGAPFVDHDSRNSDNLGLIGFGRDSVQLAHRGSYVDTVGVMKDDGRTLTSMGGSKPTFMHRFEFDSSLASGSGRGRGGTVNRGRGGGRGGRGRASTTPTVTPPPTRGGRGGRGGRGRGRGRQ